MQVIDNNQILALDCFDKLWSTSYSRPRVTRRGASSCDKHHNKGLSGKCKVLANKYIIAHSLYRLPPLLYPQLTHFVVCSLAFSG